MQNLEAIAKMVEGGAMDKDIAEQCGVSYQSFSDYVRRGREAKEKADNGEKLTEKEQRFVEFLEAYAHARKKPDEVVENALFLSCQDRTIDETITIKRYDPKGELLWIEEKTRKVPVAASVPAQQFYLANKKRKDWEYKPDKSAEQTGDDRKAIILTERGKAKEAKK